MTELFEHISDRVMAVDAIRMVDYDMGQLEQKPLPPLDYPAALIAFPDAEFEHISDALQEAPALVELRLAYRIFDATRTYQDQLPGQHRTEGLRHLATLQEVNQQLHQLAGESFRDLVRVRQSTERRSDLRVYRITYRVRYREQVVPQQYRPWREAGGHDGGPDFSLTNISSNVSHR